MPNRRLGHSYDDWMQGAPRPSSTLYIYADTELMYIEEFKITRARAAIQSNWREKPDATWTIQHKSGEVLETYKNGVRIKP